jgi:hypothetical protein
MLNKYKHKIKVEIPFNENDFIDIIKKLIDVNHKYYYLKNISKYVKSISVNSKYVNNNTIKNLFPDKKNKIYYDYISQDISVYCFPQNKITNDFNEHILYISYKKFVYVLKENGKISPYSTSFLYEHNLTLPNYITFFFNSNNTELYDNIYSKISNIINVMNKMNKINDIEKLNILYYYSDREEFLLFINNYIAENEYKNHKESKKKRVLGDPFWSRSVLEYLYFDKLNID